MRRATPGGNRHLPDVAPGGVEHGLALRRAEVRDDLQDANVGIAYCQGWPLRRYGRGRGAAPPGHLRRSGCVAAHGLARLLDREVLLVAIVVFHTKAGLALATGGSLISANQRKRS